MKALEEGQDILFDELKKADPRRSQSIYSNRSSLNCDAADYYRKYEDNDHTHQLSYNVVGECYLNFSKLLQSEMRKLEKRDSSILSQKMSLSLKKSNSQARNTNRSAYKLSVKAKNEEGV